MNAKMYRLRSHVDESLNREFDSLEEMETCISETQLSEDDAAMEEWIDDRIAPANSGYRKVEY